MKTIDKNGNQDWQNEQGQDHRENGPACIQPNGNQFWLKNGKWHRENGPAVIWDDGSLGWYEEGKLIKLEEP